MAPSLLVGNDVVDLADPRCAEKALHERFVQRVFAPEEVEVIESSADPERTLWILWAGKEAAYKVVTKILGDPPVFEHAAFVVRVWEDIPRERWTDSPMTGVTHAPPPPAAFPGAVGYRDLEIPLRYHVTQDFVHALAWHPDLGGDAVEERIESLVEELPPLAPADEGHWREDMIPLFTRREWTSIHMRPSAVVRLEVREAVRRRLHAEPGTVEILCPEGRPGRAPPFVEIGKQAAPVDISLSHHGRFVAWALATET